MHNPKIVDWRYFRFIVEEQLQDFYLPRLYAPLSVRWPEGEAEFVAAAQAVLERLPGDCSELFRISLLASMLLSGGPNRKTNLVKWMKDTGSAGLLNPLSLSKAIEGTWRTVPVVVIINRRPSIVNRRPSIVRFLVGAISNSAKVDASWPSWTDRLLSSESKEAVRDAFDAASSLAGIRRRLFTFPIAVPAATPQINGRSLGLPLGIGGLASLLGSDLPRIWLATGYLQADQKVSTVVRFLEEKCDCAGKEGFQLFLHPDNRQRALCAHVTLEQIPVSTLEQGWRWIKLYEPGRGHELQRLDVALQSAENFVNNLPQLAPSLIDWCREHEKAVLLNEILHDEDLLCSLVSVLKKGMDDRKYDHSQALARFMNKDSALRIAGKTSPTQAFLWCSHNLTLANHFGDLKEAKRWATRAERYVKTAFQNVPDSVYSFRNRKVVMIRHNSFLFNARLPRSFTKDQKQAEKYWQPGTINYSVGSFYGTKCQNYAFCGPRFIKKTEECAQKAMKAFGNGALGIEQRFIRAYHQQFSYLFYAFLDAKDFSKAWNYFLKSLKISRCEDLNDDILQNPWTQYGLARFLADLPANADDDDLPSKDQRDTFIKGMIDRISQATDLPHWHPWQLYAYNVGRLAARDIKNDAANNAWRLALSCCRAIKGETVQVMKLLPLTSLQNNSQITNEEIDEARQVIELIRSSRFLNQKHFEDLLPVELEVEAALDRVACHPEKYFPFNYR